MIRRVESGSDRTVEIGIASGNRRSRDIGIGQQVDRIRISRIEFHCGLEIIFRFLPAALRRSM